MLFPSLESKVFIFPPPSNILYILNLSTVADSIAVSSSILFLIDKATGQNPDRKRLDNTLKSIDLDLPTLKRVLKYSYFLRLLIHLTTLTRLACLCFTYLCILLSQVDQENQE